MVNAVLTIYGLLLLSGAYFGFKAGSKISLYMGISTGILVLAGVFWSNSNPNGGIGLVAVLSGLLAVTFLIRLIKTKKMMPSGMLLVVSVIAFIISILQLING